MAWSSDVFSVGSEGGALYHSGHGVQQNKFKCGSDSLGVTLREFPLGAEVKLKRREADRENAMKL